MTKDETSTNENFGRLFVQHQSQIYGYIRALAVNRHDAEEVLQETSAVLWQKFDQFEPDSNFLSWALAVAYREACSFRRRRRRESLVLSESLALLVADEMASDTSGVRDVGDALVACLGQLAERDRKLVRQRYQNDGNVRQFAESLGRPASTIYNALSRIHRRLFKCIQHRLASQGPS